MQGKFRFRRADTWNFCIEQSRVVQDEKSPNFGQEQWDAVSYFGNVRHLLKAALHLGIEGEGVKAFQKSLKASEEAVLSALDEAIKKGLFTHDGCLAEGIIEARSKMKEVA